MEQNNEISPTPTYWDGESIIIGAFTDEGLPVLIPPADHKVPELPKQTRGGGMTAEDLDRKCSDMEYNNRWYRND